MDKLFFIQLIVSFIVGGSFVALLTFFAERTNSRLSGIILAFPSTALFGFFFLAWTQSAEKVTSIIPATLVSMGLSVLFPVFYVYIARVGMRFIKKRLLLIIFSFCISVISWLLLSFVVVEYKLSSLLYGIIGYLFLTIIAYVLLRQSETKQLPNHVYSIGQIIGRALFIGFIIALVVYLGEYVDPFWGGVVTMFPAALSCSLVIIHWYYGSETLLAVFREVPLGSLSIFVYAMVVMMTFPRMGFIWGSLIALTASLFTAFMLSVILQWHKNYNQ